MSDMVGEEGGGRWRWMSGREEGYISQEGGCLDTFGRAMCLLNMCDGVSRLSSEQRVDKLTFGQLRFPLTISIPPGFSTRARLTFSRFIHSSRKSRPDSFSASLADSLLVHSMSRRLTLGNYS